MRYITIIFIMLLLFPSATALKVGVYDNPPLVFVENGEVKGFYIDIIEDIARKEGWELEYIQAPFPTLLEKLENGEIDLLVDIAYTEERSERIKFNNETVLIDWGVVVSGTQLDSIPDLENLRIAGVKGDIYFENLKKLTNTFNIDCQFVEVEGDYKDVMEYVKSGKADAGVVSRIYASLFAQKFGLQKSNIIFYPVDLRFAGKDEAILAAIDENLAEIKQDPDSIYYKAFDRWFGSEVGIISPWIIQAVTVSAILLIFALILIIYFRHEVAKRTRALKEREAFLRAVFNAIQDGISVLDEDMNILMVNHAMERWYGKVVGKKCYEAYHDRESICENCPSIAAMKSGKMRSGVVPGPGNTVEWVELFCYPIIEKGKPKMVVEFVRDITERKKMQEELKKTVQKYKYLWNNVNDIFYVHDIDGRVLDFNKKAVEVFKKKIDTIWDVIPDPYHDFIREKIEEVKTTKLPTKPFEVPVMVNGREIWLEVVAHPVMENREVVAIHGIARDVTDRRMLIEEIGENIKLVSYLVDRIRNPLAAARAFCELRDKLGNEVFDKVVENIDRVTSLISDLDRVWSNLERLRKGLRK